MANEPTKLTTADLRKRLHAAPVAAPISFPEEVAEAAPPRPTGQSRYGQSFDLGQMPNDVAIPLSYDSGPGLDVMGYSSGDSTPIPTSHRSSRMLRRPDLTTASNINLPTPKSDPFVNMPADFDPQIVDQLQAENQQLNSLLEEMRQLLQEASDQQDKLTQQNTQLHEALEQAYAKVAEYEEIISKKPKTPDELEEWSDELERETARMAKERRMIDEDRQQLREDEASLEKQMRQMEVSMARERALIARQETELKRLSAEIQREIESIQRGDATLRDRMSIFQRRHAEAMGGVSPSTTPTPPPGGSYAGFGPTVPTAMPVEPTPTPAQNKKNDTTGLLRKIFRSGE